MALTSTTNEGMRQSAILMRDTKDEINKIITRMEGYVHEMNFKAVSADKFRAAMSDWKAEATPITEDLESMAKRLDSGGDNILNTENNNQVTGKFF